MRLKLFLFIAVFSVAAAVPADIVVYDGDTKGTDYENWWGFPKTSFTNTNLSPHSGSYCGKWMSKTAAGSSGGAQICDPNWAGIDISYMTNISFWAKGLVGGEAVSLMFFTVDPDGAGPLGNTLLSVALSGLTTSWVKYSYSRAAVLAGKSPDPGAPLTMFEGLQLTSAGPGTVFFDDMIIATCGAPAGKILNGDDAASSLRTTGTNSQIQDWYGSPRIVVTNDSVVSGSGCEKFSALTNNAETTIFFPGWGLLNATKNSKLVFWVRGQNGGEGFTFKIRDSNNQWSNPFHITGLTASWTKVTIPVYDLAKDTLFDLALVQAVDFTWSDGPCTFYVDDMEFALSGEYRIDSSSCSPSTVSNAVPNSVQFLATISAAGPQGSKATNRIVYLDLSPVSGPSNAVLTNTGGNQWRGTFTIPAGASPEVHDLVVTISNSLGDVFKTPVFALTVVGPPTPPDVTAALVASADSIAVSWQDMSVETGYTLYRSFSNDTNTAAATASLAQNTASATDSGLSQNTMYYFWVKAVNALGTSGFSDVLSNSIVPPALPAVNFALAVATNAVWLNWQNIANETSYTLYRNSADDTNTAVKAGGTPSDFTNFLFTGLTPDTLYYLWVKACKGVLKSGFSGPVTNRTLPRPPVRPVMLSVAPVDGATNLMTVVWNNATNELGYKLYRNTVKSTNGGTNVLLPANWTNVTDINLKAGTTYYYWVKAVNLGGWSPLSLIASNTTLSVPVRPVLTPVSSLSTNVLAVSWIDLPNETSYTLYRSLADNTNAATNISGFIANVTGFTDSSLSNETTYYYWLKAYNSVGVSGFSLVRSGTTRAPVRFVVPSEDFAVYPNLLDLSVPGAEASFVFAKTGAAKLLVYTSRGSLVRTVVDGPVSAGDVLTWDGTADSGGLVGAGIYVAVIKGAGFSQKPLKFIITK
jgi:hypothetical protein